MHVENSLEFGLICVATNRYVTFLPVVSKIKGTTSNVVNAKIWDFNNVSVLTLRCVKYLSNFT